MADILSQLGSAFNSGWSGRDSVDWRQSWWLYVTRVVVRCQPQDWARRCNALVAKEVADRRVFSGFRAPEMGMYN